MPLRSAVFVVVLLLAGAPSAVQLCELRCGAVASRASDTGVGSAHGCHDSGSAQAALHSGTHVCGHSEALLQATSGGMLEMPSWLNLAILSAPAALLRDTPAVRQAVVHDDASPPHTLIVIHQLRI